METPSTQIRKRTVQQTLQRSIIKHYVVYESADVCLWNVYLIKQQL